MILFRCILILKFIVVNLIIQSVSNAKIIQHYPIEEEIINANRRFQQPMEETDQPHSHPYQNSNYKWKQSAVTDDVTNVRAEIDRLNTTFVYQSQWPNMRRKFGFVTAVTFDMQGNVVILHRGDRIWTTGSFNNDNVFLERFRGPIMENAIIAFDRTSGNVVYEWGNNLFYMPHGLTIDGENNIWVADVAMHQILKFSSHGLGDKPLLEIGKLFTPGRGDSTLCKPTSVAVLPNGDFFVADGYCNSRVIKFSRDGQKLFVWGQNSFLGDTYKTAPESFFAIPNALTFLPDQNLLCVADRENGRIQCFYSNNGTFDSQYYSNIIGDRLFSMDYAPIEGGQFFIVNGPAAPFTSKHQYTEVQGYVIDTKTQQVSSKFSINDLQFRSPHDIAVTVDGNEIYVAELNPPRVHKFLSTKITKVSRMSSIKPTTLIPLASDAVLEKNLLKNTQSGSTALLVGSLIVAFTLLTIGMTLLLSRRHKLGCLPFGVRNRRHRHAWDFPSKADGFKLGSILDRKRGFEKLDQNASDEEPDASTNMLASAQFA